jgi:hypothetical protein
MKGNRKITAASETILCQANLERRSHLIVIINIVIPHEHI